MSTTAYKNVIPLEMIKLKLYQWPALSICLAVSTVSFALVLWAASAGWPGPVTSNCYEDYLVQPDCFCERLRGDKPADVWMAQPMNTISNLWFVVAGLLIAYAADSRSLPSKEWWNKFNLITQDKLYSTTYALSACILGIGSTCLHASFTTWGRQMDMSAMYLIATFGLLYPFVKHHQVSREQAIWIYLFSNFCLIYWVFLVGTPDQTRKLFSTMLPTSWAIELLWVDEEHAKRNTHARRILMSTIAMFAAATALWKASESAGPLCYPDSLWQGHSLWHFLSSAAIVGQYTYMLAEKGKPPRKVVIENTPHPETMSDSASESGSVSS